MSIRKLRAGRVPRITASEYIGEKGTIFWNESNGEFRLSDGETPGGIRVGFPVASLTEIGGIKLGPGVLLNSEDQLVIDSTGLSFNFGDFQATTPANGAATLSSIQENQDIAIVSNGTGVINMVGDFHVHRTADYNPIQPDTDGAVFAIKSDGQIQMKVPLSDSTTGALEIIGNDTGLFLAPNQTGVILHVTGNSGLVSRNYFDANANYVLLGGRRYNGTQVAPRRVNSGEVLLRIVGQGAAAATSDGAATFQPFGPARIEFRATEDQTPTAQGGEVRILATANGSAASATDTLVATFNATTGLTATKFVGPLTGNVTGNADTVTNGVYTTDTGTVTNTMLAGSIANNKLANSSITVNGSSIALGGSATVTAAAGTLTGTTLNATVVTSSLTSVGTLTALTVSGTTAMANFSGKYIRTVRDAGVIGTGGTVTIDFSTDAIVYCTWGDGMNVAYQNYTAGRIVKLIATKTSGGNNDPISLDGITAANVSNGLTATANIVQGTTAFVEFTCCGTTIGSVYAKL